MADCIAIAICAGDHRVIGLDGLGTQADSFDDIDDRSVDFVAAMTHTAPRDVHVEVRIA